jgi:asparagine synthase (glutamine-hydrolysing)
MCGISISENYFKDELIKHRGIQSHSLMQNGRKYTHHRLPIQTLEDDIWDQPVYIKDGWYMMFNGEIFNYDTEKYDNDVEYLQTYFQTTMSMKDIVEEMNKWDGFWAIVLFNDEEIIAFTDPLGKKQLYYNKDTFEICSEVKGLTRTGIIDRQMVSTVNKWGYNTDDRTIFEDVRRVMPNTIYNFSPGHKDISLIPNYYDWTKNVPEESVHDLLEESVTRRLISKKYKVSALFSAGLDSTIILYFLRKYGADVDVYSIDNAEDGEFVRFMEKEWDLDLKFLEVDPNNIPHDEKMKIYDINDSMIDLGSVIPQYYLFKDITNKIVLTGDGADELFGGYRRISQYDSQKSDVFEELPFYHLVRIDRMSMHFTIECRNPFLGHDVVKKALSLPFSERTHKKILKDQFRGLIPDEIIDRSKNPLKIKKIRENEFEYRSGLIKDYLEHLKTSLRN